MLIGCLVTKQLKLYGQSRILRASPTTKLGAPFRAYVRAAGLRIIREKNRQINRTCNF